MGLQNPPKSISNKTVTKIDLTKIWHNKIRKKKKKKRKNPNVDKYGETQQG